MIIFFVLYLIGIHGIRMGLTLECYSCSDGEDCGVLFSPNSGNVEIVKVPDNTTFYSCSITVTPEGLTTRDIVRAYQCRSSPRQFCCNENLCNSLPSPPLPAFTSLKCAVSKCIKSNGVCIYDSSHITVLSSATESCSITLGDQNHHFYKKACKPSLSEMHSMTSKLISSTPSGIPSNAVPTFCCNSPECNTGVLSNAVKDVSLRCYTCDSRITGMAGCVDFNESSPHVYKAGTSSRSESCATIVGFKGRDAITGSTYPDFAIRTFIPNCANQPLGRVSYGGIYFQGIIECCKSHYCNTKILRQKQKTHSKLPRKRIIIGIAIASMLFTLVAVIVGFLIYRFCKKPNGGDKSTHKNDPEPVVIPLLNTGGSTPLRNTIDTRYPEKNAAPKPVKA